MTVREFIKILMDYNLDAPIYDNLYRTPELSFGGNDGTPKKECDYVKISGSDYENIK